MLSMTGFGTSSRADGGFSVQVEVRSVNNRFFKAAFKLSRNLSPWEAELEAVVREFVTRGTVTITVLLRETETKAAYYINAAQVKEHMRVASDLARETCSALPEIGTILLLPGVVCPIEDDAGPSDVVIDRVKDVLREACRELVKMRGHEGETLRAELGRILDRLAATIDRIAERSPIVVEEYRDKLKKRLQKLLVDVADKVSVTDDVLLRECAVFADRADIAEELQRSRSHIEQFRSIMAKDKDAGKKLDFLCQEMLREANTIASKSADSQIAHAVVEQKTDLERLREQVQNIE